LLLFAANAMAEKRRYTVTLPDHVANAVEERAKPLGASPTEYAADVLRWWFGQGCPPVTHDETALIAANIQKRIRPVPADIHAMSLDPETVYRIDDDKIVERLLSQLKVPNLFAAAAEHDKARIAVAFDNHPTHWLQFDFFKGCEKPEQDGLLFQAYPKSSVTRAEMLKRLQAEAKEMEAKGPFNFSQIPMLEKKGWSNQTGTKVHVSS
jgi:hypothetical protein